MHPRLTPLVMLILLIGCAPRPGQWQKVVEVETTAREFRVEKLGILSFRCADPSVGDVVADSVATNLLDSSFMVIERTYLAEIVREQGLSITGLTEMSDYRKIGHLVDVDFLLVGSVGLMQYVRGFQRLSYINSASARVVDVNTGQVVISVSYKTPRGAGKGHWANPSVVGEAIGEAIQQELEKSN